jgi:hypothetical protein
MGAGIYLHFRAAKVSVQKQNLKRKIESETDVEKLKSRECFITFAICNLLKY